MEEKIQIDLSKNEAIVLFEFLSRFSDQYFGQFLKNNFR